MKPQRLLFIISLYLLISCSKNGSNAPSEPTPSENATEITNAYLDKTSGYCGDHEGEYWASSTGTASGNQFTSNIKIIAGENTCSLTSNSIPNYDFDDGAFHEAVAYQNLSMKIYNNPQMANTTTALSLNYYNGILLNGVTVDLLSAGCFGVGNGMIGCFDINTPWRSDPGSSLNNFGVDEHNAHTQPGGLYHYHSDPGALYNPTDVSRASPVIGFAADGFPMYGPFAKIGGDIRSVTSSYQLKSGSRPSESGSPGGLYNGKYIDDYEYVSGNGDLDECNGMTVDGQYGYYLSSGYPYLIGCFKGTPHSSFAKGGP